MADQQQIAPPTAEEELLKRNTDCVYFLASPLTCKKGSECEYRHSDFARLNPRDCWYWLNGNCSNPKCAFRHPPLDGLFGAEGPTHMGISPQFQTQAATVVNAPYAVGKQGVPCVFYQKGYCLKGDRCLFVHAPNSINNQLVQPAQSALPTPVTNPPSLKKTFGGVEKSTTQEQKGVEKSTTQEQKVSQSNIHPLNAEFVSQSKTVVKEAAPLARSGIVDKYAIVGDELPRYRGSSIPPASNESLIMSHVHQAHLSDSDSVRTGKDEEEFSREPSPGFDVLVDHELEESDYYQSEEHLGKSGGHGGSNINPENDYDRHHSDDFNSMANVDREVFRDFDSHDRIHGQYALEGRRISAERMSNHVERRRYPRAESPDQIDRSDLRYRISKQRLAGNGNGLRSVINHERSYAEDRRVRGPRNDGRDQKESLSSRFRGRIKLPGKSTSPVDERGMDVERHRNRYSPGRLNVHYNQGRLRDRIKGRLVDDLDEGRDFRGPRTRRYMNENDFAGPRILSELKASVTDSPSLGKRKFLNLEGHQQSEDDLSFEGPKPLSEILKRKRGVETSESNVDNNQKNGDESLHKSGVMYTNNNVKSNPVSNVSGGEDTKTDSVDTNKGMLPEGQSAVPEIATQLENEEGLADEDAMYDAELEGYEGEEGDYYYEQGDGEEYNLEEGENGEYEEGENGEYDEYIEEKDVGEGKTDAVLS